MSASDDRQPEPRSRLAYKYGTWIRQHPGTPSARDRGPRTGPVVQLDGVTVIYGKNQALQGRQRASFAPGAVGLLGPNGAGKSTMLKALLGLRQAGPRGA